MPNFYGEKIKTGYSNTKQGKGEGEGEEQVCSICEEKKVNVMLSCYVRECINVLAFLL
jgi:hypothetical protein